MRLFSWRKKSGEVVEGLERDNTVKTETYFRWCLVGRFLTTRNIDFNAMKNMMASLWHPVKGMYVKELNLNLFFYSNFSMNWIFNGF